MATHFADRLLEAIRAKDAPVCVGYDPVLKSLPPVIRKQFAIEPADEARFGATERESAAKAILAHGRGVIEAVAALVPAIKINIAFFEPLGPEGIRVYHQLIADGRAAGLIVVGDIKRADIGHSTAQYALAHLGCGSPSDCDGLPKPDAVTVNPYLGIDGVGPFVDVANACGRGVFVLVQTSNETAALIQGLQLADGDAKARGATVAERVGVLVQEWASKRDLVGSSGYSLIGAVVAPRDREGAKRLRERMPHCLFLVPGFGAQGLSAKDVSLCFKPDRTGALVNASRSVIFAHEDPKYKDSADEDWRDCVAKACEAFVASIRTALR